MRLRSNSLLLSSAVAGDFGEAYCGRRLTSVMSFGGEFRVDDDVALLVLDDFRLVVDEFDLWL